MSEKELVSFVIPCYNSTNTLDRVVAEIGKVMTEKLSQFNYEIILVNDCSPDGTTYEKICEIAKKDSRVKGINLARNFGQPSAVMAALNHTKGDYVVCGDDDGQTPFAELPRLFDKMDEGYDAVEAKFIQHEKRSLFRKFGTFMNENMQTWVIDKPKGVVLTTFWLVKRFVADEMCKYTNAHPYLGGLILRSTKNVCNVEVVKNDRLSGKSGYNIRKMVELFLNGVTTFSVKPLRVAMFLGILVGTLGILFGIVTIVRKIIDPTINAGYSSMMAVILILFGILFAVLGVFGEYIGQTYIALNRAPQYVIRERINLEKEEDDEKKA
jgi:undecaprenyl-phosphate 4-deoxy-4-formamido-L-arabinose transferase